MSCDGSSRLASSGPLDQNATVGAGNVVANPLRVPAMAGDVRRGRGGKTGTKSPAEAAAPSQRSDPEWMPSPSSSSWAVDAAIAGRVPPGLAPVLDADYRPTFFFVRISDILTLALLGALSVFRGSVRGSSLEHVLVAIVLFVILAQGVLIVVAAPFPGWEEWKMPVKAGSLMVVALSIVVNHVHSTREDGGTWISEGALRTMSTSLVALASLLFLVLFFGFWIVLLGGAQTEEVALLKEDDPHRSRLDLCCSRARTPTSGPHEASGVVSGMTEGVPRHRPDHALHSGYNPVAQARLNRVSRFRNNRSRPSLAGVSNWSGPHSRLQLGTSTRALVASASGGSGDGDEGIRQTFAPSVSRRALTVGGRSGSNRGLAVGGKRRRAGRAV